MNVRMDFAPERASAGVLVDIFQDDDPRPGYREDMIPPVGAVQESCEVIHTAAIDRQHVGPYAAGDGIPDDRRLMREDAANAGIRESLVSETDFKCFNRIGGRTRSKIPQLLQNFSGKFHIRVLFVAHRSAPTLY